MNGDSGNRTPEPLTSNERAALAARVRTNAVDVRAIIRAGQSIQPTVELVEFFDAVARALSGEPGSADEITANRHADAQQWREAIAERDRLRAALESVLDEACCPDTPAFKAARDTARQLLSGERSSVVEPPSAAPYDPCAPRTDERERMSAAVEAAAARKRAYYETHDPPHCPTCGCGASEPNTPAPQS